MAFVDLPVRDEACRGELGDYYLQVIHTHPLYHFEERPASLQVSLGKTILHGEDALVSGKEALTIYDGENRYTFHPEPRRMGAVSLVRLCSRHPSAVLEVVENVIAVPPDSETHKIVGNEYPPYNNRNNVMVGKVDVDRPEFSALNPIPVVYLLHSSYLAKHAEHTGVDSIVPNLRFGLLGGEVRIEWASISQEQTA